MKNARKSPALQVLTLVYRHQGHQMGRSNERFDDAMRSALRLCIAFGLEFSMDDVRFLERGFTTDDFEPHWTACEMDYALACGAERGRSNPSFCKAYEKARARNPFLIADRGRVTPTRIYVGRQFDWQGARVTCTSFAGDGLSLTACSYTLSRDGYRNKIAKRFRIDHEAIRQARTAVSQTSETKE